MSPIGMPLAKAPMAISSPLMPSTSMLPQMRMAMAVRVQTRPESMLGPSMAMRPSRTAFLLAEAPCMMDAVPIPASLTRAARRAPMMAMPASAPIPARRLKASRNMLATAAGTAWRFVRMM